MSRHKMLQEPREGTGAQAGQSGKAPHGDGTLRQDLAMEGKLSFTNLVDKRSNGKEEKRFLRAYAKSLQAKD